jgi:hypothetical protein
LDDAPLDSAAAQVAVQSLDDLFFRGLRVRVDQCGGVHGDPRDAEGALRRLRVQDGLLHAVQPASSPALTVVEVPVALALSEADLPLA